MLTGRGLIEADKFFTTYPVEIGRSNASARSKRGTVDFAAHAAVAVEHVADGSLDFEGNATAQTTRA